MADNSNLRDAMDVPRRSALAGDGKALRFAVLMAMAGLAAGALGLGVALASTFAVDVVPVWMLPALDWPSGDVALASKPKGNPGRAFTAQAYPSEARRRGEEGRVEAELLIDERGRPRDCRIAVSSGHRTLDAATCRIGMAQSYSPGRSAAGKVVTSIFPLKVRWQLD